MSPGRHRWQPAGCSGTEPSANGNDLPRVFRRRTASTGIPRACSYDVAPAEELGVLRKFMNMNVVHIAIACALLSAGVTTFAEPDKVTFAPSKPGQIGSILCEFFEGINGGQVSDLLNNPAFPLKPTYSELAKSFELPALEEEHYGAAI